MANNREWTTRELAYLRQHYSAGTPMAEMVEEIGRTSAAIIQRAKVLGLRRPCMSTRQAIRNFEELHGKPLVEIAKEYRDRRLSRSELAGDIGIIYQNLRKFLPAELWQSWPFMTIGRIDANKTRQKAA